MEDPKDLLEYKTDHDLLIELRTIVLLMTKKLDEITNGYVTQQEFMPIKMLVYGFVALVTTSFIGSLFYLVFKH